LPVTKDSETVDVELPLAEESTDIDVELPTVEESTDIDIELPLAEESASGDIDLSLPDEIGISETPDIDLDITEETPEESLMLPGGAQQEGETPLVTAPESDNALLDEMRTQTDLLKQIADREGLS
jgi:hypothetical protein